VPDPEERKWIRTLYDREVRYVDEGIGALLAELEAARAYEDALIVLTSDHGEEFWEHDGFEHGHSLYNEVLQVPLVVKGPDVPRGRWVEHPVSTQDVMGTVLDLCGGCGAAPRSSASLRPLWQGGAAPSRPLVSTGMLYYDERLALFFGEYKYLRNVVTGNEELYHLVSDFEERRSLVQAGGEALESARRIASAELEAARLLRRELGLPDEAEAQSLDSATVEQLRSLGYVH
jgi:arylsulfatase A-like enzyme